MPAKSTTPVRISRFQSRTYSQHILLSGGQVGHKYTDVMRGFSAKIPDSFMDQLQSLQSDGLIDYIGTFGLGSLRTTCSR
jgi:hypothetical protein